MFKKRYNIMLKPDYVIALDKYCKENGYSRSSTLNSLLYDFLKNNNISIDINNNIDGQEVIY